MRIWQARIETPLGPMRAKGHEALTDLVFDETVEAVEIDPIAARLQRELDEYFEGIRTSFDVPLSLASGTPFQQRVWNALVQIPYGATRTYGDLARQFGDPNLARAVGSANGANPIAILVPCHRVIGASGDLTGYAFGLERKQQLLAIESGQRALI